MMLAPGKILGGRYRILELIGEGGMGLVYKAECTLLERTVAVKVLRPQFTSDPDFVARFRREAMAAARLSHPHVVAVYDVGQEDDIHYIVMEYVQGESLKEIIRRHAPLVAGQAVAIAEQICQALAHAHERGLIHRDIKPHNILINEEGQVKVTDFGIARAASATGVTQTGTILGSVQYFSPEQARGEGVGVQSDLYSLGIVLYEMVTGTLPFDGESPIAVALKQIQEEPEPPHRRNSRVPGWLEGIILKALQKNPAERYRSAAEMLEDLRRWAALGEQATQVMRPLTGIASRKKDGKERKEEGEKGVRRRGPRWGRILAYTFMGLTGLTLLMLAAFFLPAYLTNVPEVEVPRLEGLSLRQAETLLRGSKLNLSVRSEEFHPEVPVNHIISQDPPPGRRLKVGRTVWVVLSKGPEYLPVPDVTGISLRDARLALTESGLRVGGQSEAYSADVPEGYVISQNPPREARLPRGGAVDLVISKGPEPQQEKIILPNYIGRNLAEVEKELIDLGLGIGQVTDDYSNLPPDTILAQKPAPGMQVAPGATVDFVVSVGNELRPEGENPQKNQPSAPLIPPTEH